MRVPTTVFVVDPDEWTQDLVCEMAENMRIPSRRFARAEDFLAACPKKKSAGCLVAEFQLPGMSGITLQETLAAERSPLSMFFLTQTPSTRLTVQAMQRGALTVLNKPASRQDLGNSLRRAVDRSKAVHFTEMAHRRVIARFVGLTPKEKYFLPFMLTGMSSKKIARQLGKNRQTVRKMRARIFKKTRTDSVGELSQMIRIAGINTEQPILPSASQQDDQLQQILDKSREFLSHASRLSVPELVGGIVHEINQPLQVITTFSAIMEIAVQQQRPLDLDELRTWNEMISKSSKLAIDIIRRFRAFVSDPKVNRRAEPLDEIVSESILMLKYSARGKNVDIEFDRQRVTAAVDRVQIQQVVMNLLKNAIDSVAKNPTKDRSVAVCISANSQSIEIIVSDNGRGVSESELASLFDAFESSKVGGLGLGLATCKRIVEAHNGEIWYEPNKPRGASFHVKLPLPSRSIADGHGT